MAKHRVGVLQYCRPFLLFKHPIVLHLIVALLIGGRSGTDSQGTSHNLLFYAEWCKIPDISQKYPFLDFSNPCRRQDNIVSVGYV